MAGYDDLLRPGRAFRALESLRQSVERRCGPEQRMAGDVRALIRFPF